ncbi:MAG: glycosyltransferase family 4 protein [Rhodothermales bacterium]
MSRPHILIVDRVSDLGGAELSLIDLVTTMTAYRYTAALPGPGPLVDRLLDRGVDVRFVPTQSWRWWLRTPRDAMTFALTLPWQIASLWRWVRFLRSTKPDIVHFNINRIIEPVLAARLLNIPSVMHFRDIPSAITYRFALGRRGFFSVMNQADAWVANSPATERDILQHARTPVSVVPNGINVDAFDRRLENRGTNGWTGGIIDARTDRAVDPVRWNGTYLVAMIAGLVLIKNHRSFLRVAKRVCDGRSDVRFLIAGSGQPEFEDGLKAYSADLGMTHRVEFLGHVDDVAALLDEIDLLLHTTEHEAFGRVFVEAMTARKPVVAFRSGGAAEIVEDGETGVLVEPGDEAAMAEAVGRLLDDAPTRQRMGVAGRARVEALYSLDSHREGISDVYDRLLSTP